MVFHLNCYIKKSFGFREVSLLFVDLTNLQGLVGAMFGSIASAVGLRGERKSGLLGRFWTLPAHRASGLVGRMIAEAVRVLLTTIVIIGVGYAVGFRFTQGPLAAVAMILLPIAFGIGFAVMVTALATMSENVPLVELVSIGCTLLMFFNSGFVPTMAYPVWLQPVIAAQPMSVAVDAMRGLSLGGPVLVPVLKMLAWSAGMIAVFLYPAIRGYRRAGRRQRYQATSSSTPRTIPTLTRALDDL